MSQTNHARYKYTPDEMGEDEFLERFVVRHEVFQEIFDELKEADFSVPNQHYIMIGHRGQGKTTLLRKLKIEVLKDKKLSKFLIPVKFSEEQYRVRQLCRLWEEVAGYLQTYYEEIFETILDDMEGHLDDDNYHVKCFLYLEKALKKNQKKLLLLIDNIDVMLGKFKDKEQRQLREILLTSSSFIIVGGSTKMFEQQYDYSKPFYEFFKIIRLESLSFKESVALLSVLGDAEQSAIIKKIIKNTPQRIETLRRVTGGVPRTIIMLFDIFIEENGTAFDDLMKVLDEVTPLYKDRMDDLPPVLQEIVDAIALNWDGMMTKEIAQKTRLESKVVSAQLKQLEKYQIVESQSVGKNKIYIIKERFFNIWYLMRYGRKKDRNRVEWLVKFLLSWYERDELEEKAKRFRKTLLYSKNLNENYIFTMGEALSYTGCLGLESEHDLKDIMKKVLQDTNSQLSKEVSKSDAEILKQVSKLRDKGELGKAIKILVNSKRESAHIFIGIAYLYDEQKNYSKAEEYYLRVIEVGKDIDIDVLNDLGNLYSEQKKYSKAEEYFLKAIDNGSIYALNNIGVLYEDQKEYKKSEEYYLKAIEKGGIRALKNICILYKDQKEYKKAEVYYLKALDSGVSGALNNLGILYEEQKKYSKAEEYYLKAIDGGDTDALNNIGNLYNEQKEYSKAEEYYLKALDSGVDGALKNICILYKVQKEYKKAEEYYFKALDSGVDGALNNIGVLYKEQKKYSKAEEYYLKAIDSGDTDALNNIGLLYEEQKKYSKAEEYYLKAIDNGYLDVLNSLAWFYFEHVKKMKKAIKLIQEDYDVEKSYHNTHTYAVLLLWAEEFSSSYEKFLEWLAYEDAMDSEEDVILYLNLLMAKGQFYKAKEFFELPKYQLKERYKPLWYALMTLMQDEFPTEIKKMGSELKQTVDEVLLEIDRYKKEYKL